MPHSVSLILPNQLFEHHPALQKDRDIYLIEETLFFNQFAFLQQKLVYQRACMRYYEKLLKNTGYTVHYIAAQSPGADIRQLLQQLAAQNITTLHLCDVADDWIKKRITYQAAKLNLTICWHPSPAFLNSHAEATDYIPKNENYFQADFYIAQRKQRGILLDNNKPEGGKWSFDEDNRKPIPNHLKIPRLPFPTAEDTLAEAKQYVATHYPDNPGSTEASWESGQKGYFPTSHSAARAWFHTFLQERFRNFGVYEDALVPNENILFHSAISPMQNIGLLEPAYILDQVLAYGNDHQVPLNSIEGFVRQVLGWREYMRLMYVQKGVFQRTNNFFDFTDRRLPDSLYSGTTGIVPVDNVIKKVLKTGYAHHIERLMVMGNFMLLTETHPGKAYQWFMELFLDAYDWVMVPNVYAMSQFADGGMMMTKPYISGSNYLLKMGKYPKGEWTAIWDGLYWRFINQYKEVFAQNPRMKMMVSLLGKMDKDKLQQHVETAEVFLERYWRR